MEFIAEESMQGMKTTKKQRLLDQSTFSCIHVQENVQLAYVIYRDYDEKYKMHHSTIECKHCAEKAAAEALEKYFEEETEEQKAERRATFSNLFMDELRKSLPESKELEGVSFGYAAYAQEAMAQPPKQFYSTPFNYTKRKSP